LDSANYIALTRQTGLLKELQITANNIANASTTGYRAEGVVFAEVIKAGNSEGGSVSMTDARVRYTSEIDGGVSQTSGKFDVAIQGAGFFQVETPNGERCAHPWHSSIIQKGNTKMQALKIAATGMDAQQMRVEVISNNLANMSTTAYNARRAEFADLHYQQIRSPGTVNASDGTILPAGVQLGLGVRPSAISMDVEQGSIRATGGQLDVAIEGSGYLEIELPSGGQAYTRDGALKMTGDGEIVTSEGYTIVPEITVPDDARSVTINADGEVYASFLDNTDDQLLGQLNLSTFSNDKGLEAIGSNMYLETTASGAAIVGEPGIDGRGTFRQGYLEESSVDPVREITELIAAQRGYELNAKVITAADQMLGATTQIR